MDKIIRLVTSIDALAVANGITERHHLDTLVGIAARELAAGKRDIEALEAARLEAKRINHEQAAHSAIAQMLNNAQLHGNPLIRAQAL